MLKIVYQIESEQLNSELEWLRDQMIFPSTQKRYDFKTGKTYEMIGIIVSPEAALPIKLRHKLLLQETYHK